MVKSIGIVSQRPNTGNTTVALNLGLALHTLGQRVIVLDADMSKSNILEHLYMRDLPIDLSTVLNNDAHIYDSVFKHKSGLRIISGKNSESLDMPDSAEKIGLQLEELAPNNDFILIDMPKNMTIMDELLKYSDAALIVHSPEYSSKSVLDMQRLLSRNKVDNLGIILNKSHENSVNSIFNIPVLSKIPTHQSIVKSFEMKHPLLYIYPSSNLSKKFFNIAERLI
jgi:MinD-like ATPase involved in chromosome partitioning or flagellar assembly